MRWTREGVMEPTSIMEAASLHQSVIPICGCGHQARFEAHGLWWHFERRGWNDQFDRALVRFWCRICGSDKRGKVRPIRLEHAKWQAGDFKLPWPDERIWKRAMARVR